MFTREYLLEFLSKPGGLLEYLGKFLTQFYFYPLAGALVLALTISTPIIICFKISKKIKNVSIGYLSIIMTALLLLMQSHYYHLMEYNIGFLLVLFFFNLVISSRSKRNKYFILLLVPVLLYIAGAYIFLFVAMYCIYNLFHEKEKYRFTYSISALILSFFTFVVYYKFVFLQPIKHYFIYPLPLLDVKNHKMLLLILTSFLVVFPALLKVKIKGNSTKIYYVSVTGILAVTIFILIKLYNQQTIRVLQMEHLVSEEKYNEAVKFHEESPSQNLIGQYLYNVSLSETNQLCERLFFGEQNFNVDALVLPWSKEHLPWGAHFFYSIGLINEAHRWAYEEMIVHGERPQNIQLLLETNLINANYKRAKKYNNLFKATLNYNKLANEYETILKDTSKISKYPKLIEKRRISPKNEFFIQIANPQNNIPLLLQSNPKNRKAFEYEMAWFLFTKDVETIINKLKELEMLGYSHIPRHLEEAVLIYYNGTQNMPDLGSLTIRKETIANFDKYVTSFKNTRNNMTLAKQKLKNDFGNTFMYYFHFK